MACLALVGLSGVSILQLLVCVKETRIDVSAGTAAAAAGVATERAESERKGFYEPVGGNDDDDDEEEGLKMALHGESGRAGGAVELVTAGFEDGEKGEEPAALTPTPTTARVPPQQLEAAAFAADDEPAQQPPSSPSPTPGLALV